MEGWWVDGWVDRGMEGWKERWKEGREGGRETGGREEGKVGRMEGGKVGGGRDRQILRKWLMHLWALAGLTFYRQLRRLETQAGVDAEVLQ